MEQATPPELVWLAATALMTGLLWMPYIVNRLTEMGAWPALSNPRPDGAARAAWAQRAAKAHANAVENLAVFAPLALAVPIAGLGTEGTATACAVYFAARAAHYVIYVLGVPVLRTVTFFTAALCQVYLALRVLDWV